MTEGAPPGEPHDQLREEAASWFARMRGEDAAAHRAAFERWLARGAAHRAAYNRIGEVFAAGKMLKDATPRADAPATRRLAPLAAAAAGGLFVAGVVSLLPHGRVAPRSEPPGAVPQARPNVRSLHLPQGGEVVLDADADLIPAVAGRPAVARLERGRARFALAQRPLPLDILAGDAEVHAQGGTFDLWLRADGSLDAQVIAGDVGIAPAVARAPTAVQRFARLFAGEHAAFAADGRTVRLAYSGTRDWPRGIFEYRGVPLNDVVEEANRYSPTKIMLAETGLGDRRVSGRFSVDEPAILARRLAGALALEVDTRRPGLLILRDPKKMSAQP